MELHSEKDKMETTKEMPCIHGVVPYTTTVMYHIFKLNSQAGILDEKRLINVGLLGYYTVYDDVEVSMFRLNVLPAAWCDFGTSGCWSQTLQLFFIKSTYLFLPVTSAST
jgi:hypothetical protein